MATLRTPVALADLQSRYSTEQLLVVKLDVTRPDEIEAAFAQAKAAFGRIDVVFNNAGLIVVGEIEGTPDEQARTEFEVRHSVHLFSMNPFLTVLRQGSIFRRRNVSRTSMKYFRENELIGGHLIRVSSAGALRALPGTGYYAAT